MADLFLRSSNATADADSGATWALAKTTLAGAIAVAVAGDRIFVSASHNELNNAIVSIVSPGTLASPVQVICVDDTGDPALPTTLAATAIVATGAGAYSLSVSGVGLYVHGIIFKLGVGSSSSINLSLATTNTGFHMYRNCEFWLSTTSTSYFLIGSGSGGAVSSAVFQNCNVKFNYTGHTIRVNQCSLRWSGGSLLSGGISPSNLFSLVGDGSELFIEGLNFSNAATSINLLLPTDRSHGISTFRNIIMPSGWTGAVTVTPTGFTTRIEGFNIDNSDTNYTAYVSTYAGTLTVDAALYRAPGLGAGSWMYNGTTQVVGISYKLVASASAEYPLIGFEGIELTGLNTVIDPTTNHVISCFFTTPGQADYTPLTNKDIGINVQYPGNSASPQGKFADDIMVLLATEEDQDSDTAGDWDDALEAHATATTYSIGTVVRPATPNGKTYYCSVGGLSHTSAPTWLTVEGGETAEGGISPVRWRCMHRQKMAVTLDATTGKIRERGWLHLTPVMYLANAVAWVDPQASVTSS